MEFEMKYGYIYMKGKYYELDENLTSKTLMKFLEVKDAEKKIARAKKMAKKLEDTLDREAVLTESIMKLEKKEFEMLDKMLSSKRKYKPKTRAHRCVDMKVGNFVLPVID